MKNIRSRVFLSTLALFISFYKVAAAGEFDWLQSGEVNLRLDIEDTRQPSVDPQGNLLDFTDYGIFLYGLFHLQGGMGKVSWVSRIRPQARYTESPDGTFSKEQNVNVDDLYIDYAIAPNRFLSSGRRNVSNGVSIGYNPTDYFAAGKDVDLRLDEQERKSQRKGDYLLAFDWLNLNSSWSIVLVPEIGSVQTKRSRLLLRYERLLEKWNSDVAGSVFIGDRPGIGMNYSQALGSNWVWYSEWSLREGRDRNILNVTRDSEEEKFFEGVIGSNYTFLNGVTWYAEYWYLENGYDNQEWREIVNLTAQSAGRLNTLNHESGLSQLVAINEGFRPRYLRQNLPFQQTQLLY